MKIRYLIILPFFLVPVFSYAGFLQDKVGNYFKDGIGNKLTDGLGAVDIIPPVLDIVAVPNYSPYTQSIPVTVHGTDDVGVSGYLYNKDCTVPLPDNINWVSTITNITVTYGLNTVCFYAKDASGNISNPEVRNITATNPQPVVSQTLAFKVSGGNSDAILYRVNGGVWIDGGTLSNGVATISITTLSGFYSVDFKGTLSGVDNTAIWRYQGSISQRTRSFKGFTKTNTGTDITLVSSPKDSVKISLPALTVGDAMMCAINGIATSCTPSGPQEWSSLSYGSYVVEVWETLGGTQWTNKNSQTFSLKLWKSSGAWLQLLKNRK